jgi:amidophosphoribosyltransferase
MPDSTRVHHECGLFGVFSAEKRKLADTVYFGLFALQHRGQESAGIAISHGSKISFHKDLGLVSEVFDKSRLNSFPEGRIAIGHVRYAPSATLNIASTQPLVFSGAQGRFAIGINGRIINASSIREKLIEEGHIFQSSRDAEVAAALINKYSDKDITEGVINAAKELKGGFAMVIATTDKLIAVRDPHAVNPIAFGQIGADYVVASETPAIECVGGTVLRDLRPGEVLVINSDGIHSHQLPGADKRSCIFELVYLSRYDSVIDGKSVYDARFEAGKRLAELYPIEGDIVAGAPDSGMLPARGYSAHSGIPYVDALTKNRYIGRAFILPEQGLREKSVKIKLNALRNNIAGKRVILVDDSIVRGTTCTKTVALLRAAGAKEVHLVVASPPVRHPCYYGVDMSSTDQLIAANSSNGDLVRKIGADSVNYLPLEDLIICSGNQGDRGFCTACFTGNYPVESE